MSLKHQLGRLLNRTGRWVRLWTDNRIRSHGVLLDVSSPSIPDEVRAALFWRTYESSELRAVGRFLDVSVATIELGASIGFLSLVTARKRRFSGPHVVVEADPRLVEILQRNLAINRCNSIQVIHGAIDYQGRSVVPFRFGNQSTTGRVGEASFLPENQGSAAVPALRLGDVLACKGIGQYALICDIEGAECDMLAGEEPPVRARCRQMIIELHRAWRGGRWYEKEDLARTVEHQWEMRPVWSDGKVWVFERG